MSGLGQGVKFRLRVLNCGCYRAAAVRCVRFLLLGYLRLVCCGQVQLALHSSCKAAGTEGCACLLQSAALEKVFQMLQQGLLHQR
jgi:hypothetical protein